MAPYFIGIDIGTQGARVVLMDAQGAIASSAEQAFLLTIVPSFMKTSFVDNAQVVTHPAYGKWINQVLEVYTRPETTASADTPETIAEIVFEAATDDKKQMHYFAGNDANQRYGWLQKEGIEAVKSAMEQYFFE